MSNAKLPIQELKNFPLFILLILTVSCTQNASDKDSKSIVSPQQPQSLTELDSSISNNPGEAGLFYERAQLYMQRGNHEAALNDMERTLLLDSTNSEYYKTLTNLFIEAGNLNSALVTASTAMKKFPQDESFSLKAAQLEIYQRNYEEAIRLLDQVLKIDIYNPHAYFWKGILFKEIGDTSKSISNFQLTVEQDPDYYDAYVQLGLLYSAKKDKLAVSYFDNALKVKPVETEPLYFKGVFYQGRGEYKKAIENLKEVVIQQPQNSKAHFKIGINYFQIDSMEKAYRSFNQAIETDPQFHEAYYMKGLCAETIGNFDEARSYYNQTLKYDPENPLALAGLKRTESL